MPKQNSKLYKSLIEKSIGSMVSAIEIYNKPDFKYREETFAILAINAWEILFKARLLKLNNHKPNSIFCYKAYQNKDGSKSTKKKILDRNRTGNPKSISIFEAMKRLWDKKDIPEDVKLNIEALIELRDNAIHFINTTSIQKPVQELGFACIRNYITIIKKWCPKSGISKYNLYLMPLAYLDGRIMATGTMTRESQNFISVVQSMMERSEPSDEFDIAIRIGVNFHKSNSFESTPVQYSKDGTPVTLSEEDIRQRFPYSYMDVCAKAKERYSDFKRGSGFNAIMKEIKRESKLCFQRKLDNTNPKSQSQYFYSTNIWQKLDLLYTRKSK